MFRGLQGHDYQKPDDISISSPKWPLPKHYRLHCLLLSSHCTTLLLSCCASWLLYRLSLSSNCSALSSTYRSSWWLHCLLPSSPCATLSSTRRTSLLSHCLSSSSRCVPHRPLVLLPVWLVVALPVSALPSRCLVVLLSCHAASCCLIVPAGCCTIIFWFPLFVPPSCPLIGCCVASPCAALSSSRRSLSPMPSNAVERCCCHQIPLPPPPLNAVSIVHRCHSCRPLPSSKTPTPTFVHHRHQRLALMSISIIASSLPIHSPHRHCCQTLSPQLNAIFIVHSHWML